MYIPIAASILPKSPCNSQHFLSWYFAISAHFSIQNKTKQNGAKTQTSRLAAAPSFTAYRSAPSSVHLNNILQRTLIDVLCVRNRSITATGTPLYRLATTGLIAPSSARANNIAFSLIFPTTARYLYYRTPGWISLAGAKAPYSLSPEWKELGENVRTTGSLNFEI